MKIKSSKSKDSTTGDIASLILSDHEPIKKLILVLKDLEVGIAKKQSAYSEFKDSLSTHAKAEAESLYIHMKEKDKLRIEAFEGDTEHALADQLMNEIDQLRNDDDMWIAKVKVLAEIVDHHIKEEEKEVLKQVKKEFEIDERIEIGKEYSRLLSQLRTKGLGKTKFNHQNNTRAEHV